MALCKGRASVFFVRERETAARISLDEKTAHNFLDENRSDSRNPRIAHQQNLHRSIDSKT